MVIAGKYDFTNWKDEFVEYLETNGIKSSTAKDYARRIEKILEEENITIQTLYFDIDKWIEEYKTGKYASVNKARHYAPSSALLKLKTFVPNLYKPYIPEKVDYTDIFAKKNGTDIIY